MSAFGRDPAKRKVKPVETAQSLLDFDLGESSDDSDFRIEDHAEESDDYSIDSDDNSKGKAGHKSDSSADSTDSEFESNVANEALSLNGHGGNVTITDLLEKAKKQSGQFQLPPNFADILICAGCLGSRSDDSNEIVECDGCGVTVHEGCYGVSDATSESSTCSSASTEPWFCETCKAGVTNPTCELCPNLGGIFKETEVGAWVHLVCALYVPGVAFSEVDRLTGVTLFEMAYSRWGARACALCVDARLARTGVAVACDAGMCKTYFHVTCGQREGLLAEAHSEEVEQADPFYAHCKLHSDKTLIKKRKRNWLALQIRTQQRNIELQANADAVAQQRIQRKLAKYRKKFLEQKANRNPPWVPTQKMPRGLGSSATAVRRLALKAQLMGIDTEAQNWQEVQLAALKDVNRKWHISPAFSVEFIGYYLDRNNRMLNMRRSLQKLVDENTVLVNQQKELKDEYEKAAQERQDKDKEVDSLKNLISKFHSAIAAVCPNKSISNILADCDAINSTFVKNASANQKYRPSVPTAAALKMGVGFPLINNPHYQQGKVLSTSRLASDQSCTVPPLMGVRCATCLGSADPHLLIKCDTCHLHYHLSCLQPPLSRPPKKSKLYIWQCSECDKSSESEIEETKVPRKRTRYSKDGTVIPPTNASANSKSPNHPVEENQSKVSKRQKSLEAEVDPLSSPKSSTKSCSKPLKIVTNAKAAQPDIHSPLKVTIKPLEPPRLADGTPISVVLLSDCSVDPVKLQAKKDKKMKKLKQKSQDYSSSAGDLATNATSKKSRKRSFTSPALTNTPLMSITPIVVDSPDISPMHNSQLSPGASSVGLTRINNENTFLSPNSSFSTLLTTNSNPISSQGTESEAAEGVIINSGEDVLTHKSNRKRRKEKHRSRYSPDLLRSPSKVHKHKRKKKNQDMENPEIPHPRITIKIKPIPKPAGSVDPQLFYVPTDSNDGPPTAFLSKRFSQSAEESSPIADVAEEPVVKIIEHPSPTLNVKAKTRSPRTSGSRKSSMGLSTSNSQTALTQCDVCLQGGDNTNLVRCDECAKRYHFTCLEPPLNKNPKKRGYSWHCADCDPTEPEST